MVRIQAAALLWSWAQISSGGNSGASAASDTRGLLTLLCTHQHDASRTSLAHMRLPLFTRVRGREILRRSPSDDTYRAEHRTSCRSPDLVDPEHVGELVDFVLRKFLQVLVLEDMDALSHEQVDVDRIEAGSLLELILGRTDLQR